MPSSSRPLNGMGTELDDDLVVLGRDDIGDFNEDNILPQNPDMLKKIHEWLDPTVYEDPSSEYRKHLTLRLPSTGSWLLSSSAYLGWHSSQENGALWIRGIPGSGKSVFAATLIDQLRQEGHPVLYFFFRQIIDANHDAAAALRDWLDQICLFSPPLQLKLKEYITESRKLETLSMADLWNLLRYALSYLPKAYLVVDALDEMDQNKDFEPFLQSLKELGGWQPSRFKVIMTSRPIAYIEKVLGATTAEMTRIRLEEKEVDVDIATYVRHRLKGSNVSIKTRTLIEKAVPGRANGIFLFAKLAMDAFLHSLSELPSHPVLESDANVEAVIQQLPKDLNNIYVNLLDVHSQRSGVSSDTQLLILQFVTHATRPIRLLEMADIVNTIQYGEEKRDLKAIKSLVRSACGPLLEILPDETVSVIHHSFTEFLNDSNRESSSYPVLEPASTHNSLALICLSYLKSCLNEPQIDKVITSNHNERSHLLPPFAQYAIRNWHIHARKAALASPGYDKTDIHNAIDDFFSDNLTSSNWIKLSTLGIQEPDPLLAAATLGLACYLKYFLDKNTGILKDYGCHTPPLCCAAEGGYDDIVEILLQVGVNPNGSDKYGQTALMFAASHNHPKVIQLLIDAGVNPFESFKYSRVPDRNFTSTGRCEWRESPFETAGRYNHFEAVAAFFPYVKTSEQVNGALSKAVSNQNLPTIKMLLQHPLIDVNSKTGGQTPLHVACRGGNAEVIELLLQAGADPNILSDTVERDQKREAALYYLAIQNHPPRVRASSERLKRTVKCFELLLAAGADPNQENYNGNRVLHSVGDESIARLLLNAGADPNVTNNDGETPLHSCRTLGVLRALLGDQRTKVNPRDLRGRTPLLSCRVEPTLLQLIESGADVTSVEKNGNGVFHHAVSVSREARRHRRLVLEDSLDNEIFKQFRKLGANINQRNKRGREALHTLCESSGHFHINRFEDTLNDLLSVGADIEAKDNDGQTPLIKFIRNPLPDRNYEGKLNALLKVGARWDTLDFRGKTLYHAYMWNGNFWRAPELVSYPDHTKRDRALFGPERIFTTLSNFNIGVGPEHVDFDGNTLWHEVCFASHYFANDPSPVLKHLKQVGIDISRPNNLGRTPLHIACLSIPQKSQRGYYDHRATHQILLSYLLGQQAIDIDHADNSGITALHLASTCCEVTTSRLLATGCDVSKATHEGLTALHLAARSRQVNTLGMLLGYLKSQTASMPGKFLEVVNAKDDSLFKATALYYACASGKSETVRLLLEAGATVDSPSSLGSPWLACATFEDEESNWRLVAAQEKRPRTPERYVGDNDYDYTPNACGVMLDDRWRPKIHGGAHSPARLDEIVDLLAKYDSSSAKYTYLRDAIISAASNKFDYTVDCLVSVYESFQPLERDFMTEFCLRRREAQRKVFENKALFEKSSEGLESKFDLLMSLREYKLVSQILQKVDFLEMDDSRSYIVHRLAAGGFTAILRDILNAEVVAKLDDWEKQRKGDPNPRYPNDEAEYPGQPLLLQLCTDATPNMDVIRFLIEEVGVDANIRAIEYHWRTGFEDGCIEFVESQGALHILARGGYWWQAAQGLPYFIQHCVDIELRDHKGLTPLHAALQNLKSIHSIKAAKLLLSKGANPNVVNNDGFSCLAHASSNANVFQLLVQHGADVTPSVFLEAIANERYEILEAVLLSGADPNIIYERENKQDICMLNTSILANEMYPLHYAAHDDLRRYSKDLETKAKIIRLLLKHGADPCAKYSRSTVMHKIIKSSRFTSIFINLPNLDLEARSSGGNTLLLTAIASSHEIYSIGDPEYQKLDRSLVEILLDRGADISARNNKGETVLHRVFRHRDRNYPQLLSMLIPKAADLINVANDANQTPLHLAVGHVYYDYSDSAGKAIEILLSAGADPHLPGEEGETIIHMLAKGVWIIAQDCELKSNKRDIFELIVGLGVDVNARDHLGETPLFKFFRSSIVKLSELQPTPGCFTNRPRGGLKTGVDESIVLEMFDRAGMDWKAVNNAGETLLHIVASKPEFLYWPGRAVNRFKFLLSKGVDVTAEDEKHRTALDIAASVDAKDLLDLFGRESA
ncbi:hypothetical protein TWF481_006725 [Arthrobotrys musiformis]|uniref:Nephrocystin 3-like N-terminal domain-containing protein n=1 Tax=Arthrobotrys musiformis TaxID=47236 RepID=A0AAV9WB87_9PEZI